MILKNRLITIADIQFNRCDKEEKMKFLQISRQKKEMKMQSEGKTQELSLSRFLITPLLLFYSLRKKAT